MKRHGGRAPAVLLPLGLLATCGFAAAEMAGCFSSLDDCAATLYLGPGCGTGGSVSGSGSGSSSSTGSTGTATSSTTTSNTTSGTGGKSSSSSTTASGTGGKPECVDAGECSVPPGPCFLRGTATCAGGKCGVDYDAGPAPSQKYGSCEQNFCNMAGMESPVQQNTNAFDNGNPCTPGKCVAGTPSNNPTLDVPCTTQTVPSGFCIPDPDPNSGMQYVCSECDPSLPMQCAMGVTTCKLGKCVVAHCTNNTLDVGETDVDCGGGACPPCVPGKKCGFYTDCYSQVCAAPDGGQPTCQKPTCMDGKQNEDETDVDCGGSICNACPAPGRCLRSSDCQSGVCMVVNGDDHATCQGASCTDGVQNGPETGVDCGGDGGCLPCL